DVIADEADRYDDDVAHAARGERAQEIVHVGLEPGLAWASAAALVREEVRVATEDARDRGRGRGELGRVGRRRRHGRRDAVGREPERGRRATLGGQGAERGAGLRRNGFDEAWVHVPGGRIDDLGRACTERRPAGVDRLHVALAARLARERREDQAERTT